MTTIALLGTCDTKLEELLYLRSALLTSGAESVLLIDVGRTPTTHVDISIALAEVLSHHPSKPPPDIDHLSTLSRNDVTSTVSAAATRLMVELHEKRQISALLSAGGSTGTSLGTAVMRLGLPIGFPKVMLSTIASGDTGCLVGETDITMIYSVVDIAGRNWVLDAVMDAAAGAACGLASAYERRIQREKAEPDQHRHETDTDTSMKKIRVAISMFGVTTPSVDHIRHRLTALSSDPDHPYTYEPLIFHATGHGGLALERLVSTHQIDAVIDLTTTEIPDHLVGGVMSAGPHRLAAALRRGIPLILSVGACDMVNFGPRATVPERFVKEGRRLYVHNPSVTLLRTSVEECGQVAEFVVEKVRQECQRPERVRILLPRAGVSAISGAGEPFEDREADEALFCGLEKGLEGSGVGVERVDGAINDEGFAKRVVEAFEEVLKI